MRIVYHLGAHCTDEERLLRCLLKNRGPLAKQGIAVPGPSRYRNLLRETANGLGRGTASREAQAYVLQQILEGDDKAERVILSWESFMAYPQWALHGGLYARAGQNLRKLHDVLPDYPVEFHLSIRNPAGFIPALLQRQRDKTYAELMQDLHPQDLLWSNVLHAIRDTNPDVPIHVWCDEDSPMIWPDVLRIVTGHQPGMTLDGQDDLLATLLAPPDLARLQQELGVRTKGDTTLRPMIIAEFLEAYALPDKMETTVDLPGWNVELVETLTLQYDQDLNRIGRIPGLTLTLP
ncbi:hypothetical protein [Neogemmobacter tilapiae]|uniref:Uncharacterized protein n=1 Tax=Neogemmobacter tilapiae TaxID=875041 RepID=A0A918TT08_9RHOB|nr:hypothetical protein [Gemmobacter tilapiae]GHC57717.1 hypothetical protein GCM10007315_21510 [Gemmobacter tilapiae]